MFGETVGRLPGSYLAQERGFEAREREFRREMDTVHSSTHSELTLQVRPASLSAENGFMSSCPPGGTVSGQAAAGCGPAAPGSVRDPSCYHHLLQQSTTLCIPHQGW